ncbi:unnamed protein product [Calicophoron daubneyi]|uniref:PH domain-containing protein n=1 Tax=Calicophoron daubneyi TaxID=300641 RepID=A0AAV2TW14_CALDB
MELESSLHVGHKCTVKDKLAELAEEVKSWEDDVRHSAKFNQSTLESPKTKSPAKNPCRESIASLNLLPVSAQKARWESLIAQNTEGSQRSQDVSKKRLGPNLNADAHKISPVKKQTSSSPVVRSSLKPGERERLERMAELEQLRRSRFMTPSVPATIQEDDLPNISLASHEADPEHTPESEDFALPPPPSPSPPPPSPPSPVEVSPSITPGESEQLDMENISPVISSDVSTRLTPPQGDKSSPSDLNVKGMRPSIDEGDEDSDSPCSVNSIELEGPTHSYYARPKFAARRVTNDVSPMLRQRSVSFEPPLGLAPGDTASEAPSESDLESNAASLDRYPMRKAAEDSTDEDIAESVESLPGVDIDNNATALADERRMNRIAELSTLLKAEQNIILQTNSALQRYVGKKPNNPSLKRTRDDNSIANASEYRGHINPLIWGPGSSAYLNANRMLVIACQRRQVLMEELSLLRRGSPVLVPPARGDPIRARLTFDAVRLSLKSSIKPGDPTSGSGFAVVDEDHLNTCSPQTRYHILAIVKCPGEGRLYHTEMVTLVPVSDLPVGTGRQVTYVDLPAKIEITPLRPDFVLNLEIYCMRIGPECPSHFHGCLSPQSSGLFSGAKNTETPNRTPKSRRPFAAFLTPSSALRKKAKTSSDSEEPSRSRIAGALTSCIPSSHGSLVCGCPLTNDSIIGRNKMTAFTLLSSVEIPYRDDMLLGRRCPDLNENRQKKGDDTLAQLNQMPYHLTRLPRSTPLSGHVGLLNAAVNLEARILTRGFMTVFEEIGGLGVWQRYWCQLRANHLEFWRNPEDEQQALKSSGCKSTPSACPLGRIDLRHVAAPRAVSAPRRICARANTIFMRSLLAVEPDRLSASLDSVSTDTSRSSSESNESLIFRASPDYRWLEQKHLLCADTPQERDSWIRWLNICLDSLKNWMPEHFARLSRYDTSLEFSQPVSSHLASVLLHGRTGDRT